MRRANKLHLYWSLFNKGESNRFVCGVGGYTPDWLLCPNYRRETDAKGLRIVPRYSETKMKKGWRKGHRMKTRVGKGIPISKIIRGFSLSTYPHVVSNERESHSSPSFVSILFFFSLSGMYCTFRFAIKGYQPLRFRVDLHFRMSTSRSSPALRALDWWRRNPPCT